MRGEIHKVAEIQYFPYKLICAANDWVEQTGQQRFTGERQFVEVVKRYLASLGELKPRISGQAWNFFANGYGRWGLHDGQLISFSIGDGLDYRPDGTSPFVLIIKGRLP